MGTWNVEKFCGYKPITTFWEDFSIADRFGESAVRDTFNRAFDDWKSNYKYLAELAIVLNHKSWVYEIISPNLCELYAELYYKVDDYAVNNLSGEELTYYYSAYYYRTLD